MDEEIARLDEEIARCGGRDDAQARAAVASAAIAKGKLLADELGRPGEAVEAFGLAFAAAVADPAAILKDRAAEALFLQSQALFDAGRADEALAAIRDLVGRFGDEADPALRFDVCHALSVTIFTLRLDDLGRDETVLSLADEAIGRFGGDAERLVRDRLLHAMIEKSFALERLGRRDAGVALRNAFRLRHLDETDPDVRAHAERVIEAMDRRFSIADADKHESGGVRFFCGRNPDAPVPEGEPLWLFYEIHVENDAILRSVELFADGRVDRNSLEIEARNGLAVSSLTDQPFLKTAYGAPLEPVSAAAFGALWEQGVDAPFWSGPRKT